MQTREVRARGFFVVSRTAQSARRPCTGGDVYQAVVGKAQLRFSAFSEETTVVGVYWINTSGVLLPGAHNLSVSVELLETQPRALQLAEGRGPLRWAEEGASPLPTWLRDFRCVGKPAPAASAVTRVLWGPLTAGEPRCGRLPVAPAASSLLCVDPLEPCGWRCSGNTSERVVNTYRGPKYADRSRLGFHHVLKPAGCRYHWHGEAEVASCLAPARSILLMGGSIALQLQRGFERLHHRPKAGSKWWFDYGRAGMENTRDLATGSTPFGDAVVRNRFIHHPFRNGLLNVIDTEAQVALFCPNGDNKGCPFWGLRSTKLNAEAMCSADLLVFESGAHDFGLPDRRSFAALRARCTGAAPCAGEQILPLLRNQTWRLRPLESYAEHLETLMGIWRECSRRKPSWRTIFKTAFAPRPTHCSIT